MGLFCKGDPAINHDNTLMRGFGQTALVLETIRDACFVIQPELRMIQIDGRGQHFRNIPPSRLDPRSGGYFAQWLAATVPSLVCKETFLDFNVCSTFCLSLIHI